MWMSVQVPALNSFEYIWITWQVYFYVLNNNQTVFNKDCTVLHFQVVHKYSNFMTSSSTPVIFCSFFLIFTIVILCSVAQLCPNLCDPLKYSLPDSSVHGIILASILEWVAISSSRGSSQPRDQTHISCISCIAGRVFTHSLTHQGSNSYLNGCKLISHCDLDFYSPMIRDTENLFRSLLATCIFSLEKYLFRSFAYFSIGLCYCCCCWIVGVFYILWVLIPYQIYDLPVSSPFPGFPGGSEGKASACNAWNLGSIPGSGRSPGEGNSKPLQYPCLENPMDREAW